MMDKYTLRKNLENIVLEANRLVDDENTSRSLLKDIYNRLNKAKEDYLDKLDENHQNVNLVEEADEIQIRLEDKLGVKEKSSAQWTKEEWVEEILKAYKSGDYEKTRTLINDFHKTSYSSNRVNEIEKKIDNKNSDEVSFEAVLKLASANSAIVLKHFDNAERIVNEAIALNNGILWDEAKGLKSEIAEGRNYQKIFEQANDDIKDGEYSKAINNLEKLNAQMNNSDNEYLNRLEDVRLIDSEYKSILKDFKNLSRHSSFSEMADVYVRLDRFSSEYEAVKSKLEKNQDQILDILAIKKGNLDNKIKSANTIEYQRNRSLKNDFEIVQEVKNEIDEYLKEKDAFRIDNDNGRLQFNYKEFDKLETLFRNLNDLNQILELGYQNAKDDSIWKKRKAYEKTNEVREKYPNDDRSIFIENQFQATRWKIVVFGLFIGIVLILVLIFGAQRFEDYRRDQHLYSTQTQLAFYKNLTPTVTFTPTSTLTPTATMTPTPTSIPASAIVSNKNNKVPVKHGCYSSYTTYYYVNGGSSVTIVGNSPFVIDDHPNYFQECVFIEGIDSSDGLKKPGYILAENLMFSNSSE